MVRGDLANFRGNNRWFECSGWFIEALLNIFENHDLYLGCTLAGVFWIDINLGF